jgi:hypothetical protein
MSSYENNTNTVGSLNNAMIQELNQLGLSQEDRLTCEELIKRGMCAEFDLKPHIILHGNGLSDPLSFCTKCNKPYHMHCQCNFSQNGLALDESKDIQNTTELIKVDALNQCFVELED